MEETACFILSDLLMKNLTDKQPGALMLGILSHIMMHIPRLHLMITGFNKKIIHRVIPVTCAKNQYL